MPDKTQPIASPSDGRQHLRRGRKATREHDDAEQEKRPFSARRLEELLAVSPFVTYREFRTLMAFATFANINGWAFPSIESLAGRAELSPSHVSAALKSLGENKVANGKQKARPPLIASFNNRGGKGISAERQLLISDFQTTPETGGVSDPEFESDVDAEGVDNTPRSDAKHPPLRRDTPPVLTPNTPRNGGRNMEGIGKEQGIEDSAAAGAAANCAAAQTAGDGAVIRVGAPKHPPTPRPATGKTSRSDADVKPAASDHATTVKRFTDGWALKYGEVYPFTGKDGKHIKDLLKQGDAAKVGTMIDAFLRDDDPWLKARQHGLGLMLVRLPQYVAASPTDADDGPGYIHTPDQRFELYRDDGVTYEQCVESYHRDLEFWGKSVPA